MRIGFGALYSFLVIAMIICAVKSWRSNKPIGKTVFLMLVGLIPPVLGNLLIIMSDTESVSIVGCYIYFVGMDLAVFALIRFTFEYCNISFPVRHGTRSKQYSSKIVEISRKEAHAVRAVPSTVPSNSSKR